MSKGVLTRNAREKYGPFLFAFTAYMVGVVINRRMEEGHRTFHNKSKLYGGRDLEPGERIW